VNEARVLRVIVCTSCGWQYGAHWPRQEVYGYWGDCPSCGRITEVRAAFLPEHRSVSIVPAQQELSF